MKNGHVDDLSQSHVKCLGLYPDMETVFYYCCVFNPNMGASGGDVPAFFSSGYFSTKQDLLL